MRLASVIITAACVAAPLTAVPAAASSEQAVTVARYTFDRGLNDVGTIIDESGRGLPLRVRSVDGGAVKFEARGTGKAAFFPAKCAGATTRCPRAILEGGDDADLDPGSRPFVYGLTLRLAASQLGGSANVMQKGVATNESQWKMQIGRKGKAQCAMVGRGSRQVYIVRSQTNVADGAWHRVACRRTTNALVVYVDGTPENSVTVPSNLSIANSMPLRLGGRNLNGRSDAFAGAMDDVYAILS